VPPSGENEIAILNSQEEFSAKFADLLANWPLYKTLAYLTSGDFNRPPKLIQVYCPSPECEDDTLWETHISSNEDYVGWKKVSYTCRHCKTAVITYHYFWIRPADHNKPRRIYKYGQHPRLPERIPKELMRRLDDEDLELYRASLRCRNQDMGLGAISYLRRVVENKINQILDEIAVEAHKYKFEEQQLQVLEKVKTDWKFSEKIKYASVILPPSLRPGEHNPVDQLHDLASEGLHYRPDGDCLEIYDRCRPVFEYLFREIDARKKSATEYAASLAKLATTRKPKASAPGT